MARILKHHNEENSYFKNDIHAPSFLLKDTIEKGNKIPHSLLGAASIYQTFQALLEVNRPMEDNSWKTFSSSRKVAWKTGTSFWLSRCMGNWCHS